MPGQWQSFGFGLSLWLASCRCSARLVEAFFFSLRLRITDCCDSDHGEYGSRWARITIEDVIRSPGPFVMAERLIGQDLSLSSSSLRGCKGSSSCCVCQVLKRDADLTRSGTAPVRLCGESSHGLFED